MFVFAAIAVVGFAALFLTNFLVVKVFERMRRLYHLTSIYYWLHHYEKRGRKCFLDPELGGEEHE